MEIHVAPKLDVDELSMVRKSLEKMMGKEFVKKSDLDKSCIHKTVKKILLFEKNLFIDL